MVESGCLCASEEVIAFGVTAEACLIINSNMLWIVKETNHIAYSTAVPKVFIEG